MTKSGWEKKEALCDVTEGTEIYSQVFLPLQTTR